MKKLLVILLTLTMVFGLVGCAGGGKDRLEQIKERGYIEICTEPYFAPMEFIDSSKSGDEQFQGVDIEMMKKIAEKIGVELRIVPLEFGAVLSGVAEGKYDLALSGIGWTPDREEAMAFSKGYITSKDDSGYGFLCREGEEGKYATKESLKDAVIIVQSGSLQDGLLKDQIGYKNVKEVKYMSSMNDCFLAVKEGKADAAVCAIGNAELYAAANGGLKTSEFRFEENEKMVGTHAAAPKKGSDKLLEVVNEVIDELAGQQMFDWYDYYKEYAASLGIE